MEAAPAIPDCTLRAAAVSRLQVFPVFPGSLWVPVASLHLDPPHLAVWLSSLRALLPWCVPALPGFASLRTLARRKMEKRPRREKNTRAAVRSGGN